MTTECSGNETADYLEEKIAPTIPQEKGKVADYELILFRNSSLADIQFFFNYIDRAALDRVITLLLDAPRVFVVGAGEDHSSAIFMTYRGGMEYPEWYVVSPSNHSWERLAKDTKVGDVVFAISTCPMHERNPFRDYTIQVAKRARDNGAKVVAIVDQTEKIISSFANEVLLVPVHGAVLRSHIMTAILIETIVGVTVMRTDF